MSRCEDVEMSRCEDVKMWKCEDVEMCKYGNEEMWKSIIGKSHIRFEWLSSSKPGWRIETIRINQLR